MKALPVNAVLAIVIPLALTAGFAQAESVYRCASSYSQSPCASGKILEVDDARTPAQKKQTDTAAQRDAKIADAMEKARLKQESHAAPAFIVPVTRPAAEKSVKPEKHAKKTARKKNDKHPADPFTATDGKLKAKEAAAPAKKKKAA